MRLLHTTKLELEGFDTHELAGIDYAILSHTWSIDRQQPEFTYDDLINSHERRGQGWQKIEDCCELARDQEIDYIWIDTCCINADNSRELEEAINSMYRFYQQAKVCYAFLSDLHTTSLVDLAACRWFTRGWTLQELLAPPEVLFYNAQMYPVGTRSDLAEQIAGITNIDKHFLKTSGRIRVDTASIAQRMSWASRRQTTKREDNAYCLMGLFNVSMFLHYGEGACNAFFRLQEQILKKPVDESLFAWSSAKGSDYDKHGMLATSPKDFQYCQHVTRTKFLKQRPPIQWGGRGLEFHYVPGSVVDFSARAALFGSLRKDLWARLDCQDESGKEIMIHLQKDPDGAARSYYRTDAVTRHYNEHHNWKSISANFDWEFKKL
ncbi:Vegetative incompatibility protein HET-E-1 [Pseudocercospora fuligena]|uniref:Vegetative incompatibility protein HET-E-1 n=1 Tax=Pseudocercospora fuligena TaxID=685502 RepID=A0A8H6RRD5_9PEZI|nr:Vegetative incompatibility protein HET-E-1 [Pseudocercospora fuligena]